jgi:hypothetical protein
MYLVGILITYFDSSDIVLSFEIHKICILFLALVLRPTYEVANFSTVNLASYVRFEVFTAVNMKNAVYWGIKPHFVPHRRHITSPQQIPAG